MQAAPETAASTANDDRQNHHDEENNGGSSKRQKSRHRASVACATCRERRIRCVVPPGENGCVQCQRAGTDCIIKNDDERRRPISRAYMSTLTDRVALLESMLKEHGAEPPPIVYPPKTTRGTLYPEGDDSPARPLAQSAQHTSKNDSHSNEGPSPRSVGDDGADGSRGSTDRSEKEGSIGTPIDDKRDGLVNRLLSTRGHLSFDQLSGRLRFYGGTVNCHIYSELEVDEANGGRETLEQAKRAEKCIRTLSIDTHDYLMDLFWQHYNGVLHVVHEEAFNEDRENGRTQFYSGFLHVCVLSMAYRFADKSRPDMQRIALPDRECTLHREAKYMLEYELERPGGIPSIAALLILGDSEVSFGRDNVGWMYSGMALRLCYDIGLHLDSRQAGLSQRETDIRKMTLWACVIYDRYWSLFLGRPLAMKTADLEVYSLTDRFERLGTLLPAGPDKSLNTRIYEVLIDLMEIAGKIVENDQVRKRHEATQKGPDQQDYFKMAQLDRELHTWVARLPQDLRYSEENRANAPISFYLLHQQFHGLMILLHRPFARYDHPGEVENEEVSALDGHFSRASRAICTKAAVAMARIFWHHRQTHDGKQIFCTAMQHAGTAATALIAALASSDGDSRNTNMRYLEVLHAALQDMAHGYQPAERMAAVLNAVMIELRGGPISPTHPVSTRRGSSNMEPERSKRRHTSQSSTRARPQQPPSTGPQQQHRASEGNIGYSMPTQPIQLTPGEYVVVPPRTDLPSWPSVPVTDRIQPPPPIVPSQGPEIPEPIGRGQDWFTHGTNDFPHVTAMAGMPGLPEGEVGQLDFLHLPSEEDWARWHSTPTSGDVSADLDGFPPRGRYQGNNNNFASPPMGGIMR